MRLPRLVVAAPASGHGKTTVATGLMAALRRAGLEVSGHKVGPDYIDPGYHALATDRPGRNLDPHLVGEDLLVPLLLHGARTPVPADVAVVEGVMGLYDGALGRRGYASTAHVAGVLGAPVVLVVDIAHASRSVAATVHGMAGYDPSVRVAGVVLNKAGSRRHAAEVRDAVAELGIEVLGVLDRDDGVEAPSRHLGLVPAAERPEAAAALDRLAAQVARAVDLDRVLAIAGAAPDLDAAPWDPATALAGHLEPEPAPGAGRPVVAVAGGRAFTFRYAETEELLRAAGLEPVTFDPTQDRALPAGTAGIYLGGGFPEVHAAELAGNAPMRHALREAVAAGTPVVAECAGLLYLCASVDGEPMVAAAPATAAMTPRLTLGYRTATAPAATLLARPGETVTGHEFHRTAVAGLAGCVPAWLLGTGEQEPSRADGWSADPAGTGTPTVHASYLHVHWAGHPALAARFAAAVRHWAGAGPQPGPGAGAGVGADVGAGVDLHHHGDREVAAGLVDLAVNVHPGPRPAWLERALRRGLADAAGYPDPGPAVAALARRHDRPEAEVLPTAGGAEAFTLLARARPWTRPVVVHPQFTEPEAALRAAGHRVHRVLVDARDGFALDPGRVPADADLVVVGNPTNPTGVLHPAETLLALARPGRVLVVDEAFMDAVPGEPASLAGTARPGLVVLRSLTKTWAIPGIRAGYVLGDAEVLAAMRAQQPPWSVSGPALAAMVACSTDEALREADRRARATAARRTALAEGLRGLGLQVADDQVTPFLLARGPHGLRQALRRRGFAVRRGDTFPGLGPEWVRVAVRDEATTAALLAAVRACLPEPARA